MSTNSLVAKPAPAKGETIPRNAPLARPLTGL